MKRILLIICILLFSGCSYNNDSNRFDSIFNGIESKEINQYEAEDSFKEIFMLDELYPDGYEISYVGIKKYQSPDGELDYHTFLITSLIDNNSYYGLVHTNNKYIAIAYEEELAKYN